MTTTAKARYTYRVYLAEDGSDLIYCGERDTLAEAQSLAATEPAGLEKALWDTARAAGHCAGFRAPEGGEEDDEPMSWHGQHGWHCVVRVRHTP